MHLGAVERFAIEPSARAARGRNAMRTADHPAPRSRFTGQNDVSKARWQVRSADHAAKAKL